MERAPRSALLDAEADLVRFTAFCAFSKGLGAPLATPFVDGVSASRYRPKDGAVMPERCGSSLGGGAPASAVFAEAAFARGTIRI